jgi:nucleoside 2-deoxyribosyltransferase
LYLQCARFRLLSLVACGFYYNLRKADAMPDSLGRPYVYLAGPDVFFPDAIARGERMKQALAARGLAGLYPLDGELDAAQFADPKEFALAIAAACEAHMHKADMGLFNIQPWRGPEADEGTAYELGFLAALGKPVVLYTNNARPFAQRIVEDVYQGQVTRDGGTLRGAADGMMVEAFEGFAANLMLVNAGVRSARALLGPRAGAGDAVHLGFEAAADFAQMLWERSAL